MKNNVLQLQSVVAVLAAGLLSTGCALYSDVSISPLYLRPGDVKHHASGVIDLVAQGDYSHALSFRQHVESKAKPSYREIAALGRAELAAGRFDDARRHLRRALSMQPFYTDAADIAWDLSQTEYLANQFAAAREWALTASSSGVNVRKWHLEYLEALSGQRVYEFSGARTSRVPMLSANPRVPRITVTVNQNHDETAIIDTGAAISIISESFAKRLDLKRLGEVEGTFYGLLGEPIPVRFAILESLTIGKLEAHFVPVAIMSDDKLHFVVANRTPFKMDLLLGANFLKEFRLELDFPASRATFTKLQPQDRYPAATQNMFWVGFRPFVHGTINRKGWYLFVLDTGSEVTFLNEAELIKTPFMNFVKYHDALLQGLGGATKRGAKVEDVSIGIDKWSGAFNNLPLYHTEQTHALGILGENFLKNFKVTIDFGTMRLILDKDMPDIPFEDEPERKPFGVASGG